MIIWSRTAMLLGVLCALSTTCWAQGQGPGVISGTVVDVATDSALTPASVALYSTADSSFVTGVATDAAGAFQFDGLPAGGYRVRVSFLGYDTVRRDTLVGIEPVRLGRLGLTATAQALGGAEVIGDRPEVQQVGDRTIYDVQNQTVTAGGNALETLQTLPSVDVDVDGNVSLRGNGDVAIHVNGRPVPLQGALLTGYLRQISASQIGSVEVIPNPSARYDPEGTGGIINIVLVQNTDRGLSGGATLGGGTAPAAELGGTLSYQRGAFDATGTLGVRYDAFDLAGTTERGIPIVGVPGFQAYDEATETLSTFTTARVDYAAAPRTALVFEGVLGQRDQAGTEDLRQFSMRGGTESGTRFADGDEAGLTASAAAVLTHDFAPPPARGRGPQHRLSLEAKAFRTRSDDDDVFTERASGVLTGLEQSTEDQTVVDAYAKADYTRPVGSGLIEGGGRLTRRSVDGMLDYSLGEPAVTAPLRSNALTYRETVLAAYGQASRSFGRLEALIGLRVETTSRAFDLLNDAPPLAGLPPLEGEADDCYTNLFPSAFLTLPIQGRSGSNLRASYSRRISRPSASQLNPFPSFEDTLTIRRGNPALSPEYTDAFEISARYNYLITVTPFYNRTTSPIRRLLTEGTSGTRVFGLANLDLQETYGVDLSVFERRGPVRAYVAGSLYRSTTSGMALGSTFSSDDIQTTARGNIRVQVAEGTSIQAFGYYRAPQETETGRVSGFGIVSLAAAHELSPSLSLAVRINDLFATSTFTFESFDGATVPLVAVRNPAIQQAFVTLSYSFGPSPDRDAPQAPEPESDSGFGF